MIKSTSASRYCIRSVLSVWLGCGINCVLEARPSVVGRQCNRAALYNMGTGQRKVNQNHSTPSSTKKNFRKPSRLTMNNPKNVYKSVYFWTLYFWEFRSAFEAVVLLFISWFLETVFFNLSKGNNSPMFRFLLHSGWVTMVGMKGHAQSWHTSMDYNAMQVFLPSYLLRVAMGIICTETIIKSKTGSTESGWGGEGEIKAQSLPGNNKNSGTIDFKQSHTTRTCLHQTFVKWFFREKR